MLTVIITTSSLIGLLIWLVGIFVVAAIIRFILQQLTAPPFAYTILYVVIALVVLLVAIDFFFGGTTTGIVAR